MKAVLPVLILISLAASAFPARLGSDVQAASGLDDWPMFHHDLAHTGYSTSSAVTTPVVLWASPKGYGGAPVVANGFVYLLDLGYVYCVNASDGRQVWNQSLPSGLPNTCPAVYEGYVYTPLTAYNATTGELVLNYTSYRGYSSPAVAGGIIYFGSVFDGSLFALNATTGSKLWSYKTGGAVTSSPSVAYGRVYFESEDGNLYALDASTGAEIWSYVLNEPSGNMDSSPTIAEGRIYIGGHESIYCLDASTGKEEWNITISANTSPGVSDGCVYVGSFGNLYALNGSSGALVWNVTGGNSSPAIADDVGYVSDSVHVAAFNLSTGERMWNYSFPQTEYYDDSSPAIVDGVVYAAGGDAIYAFATSTVTPKEPFPWLPIVSAVSVAIIAIVAMAVLVCLKKRKPPLDSSELNPDAV